MQFKNYFVFIIFIKIGLAAFRIFRNIFTDLINLLIATLFNVYRTAQLRWVCQSPRRGSPVGKIPPSCNDHQFANCHVELS